MRKVLVPILLVVILTSCSTSPKAEEPLEQIQSEEKEVFSSKVLDIEFSLPTDIKTCSENEYVSDGTSPIQGYESQGSQMRIFCYDKNDEALLYLNGISPDFTPYEGQWPSGTHPNNETMDTWCANEDYYCKPYENVYIMASYWGSDPGGTYWISSYVELPQNQTYETIRIGMRLPPLPDYTDPDFESKVDAFISGEMDEVSLERINNFMSIIEEIKSYPSK
jgi:hypothetical protein